MPLRRPTVEDQKNNLARYHLDRIDNTTIGFVARERYGSNGRRAIVLAIGTVARSEYQDIDRLKSTRRKLWRFESKDSKRLKGVHAENEQINARNDTARSNIAKLGMLVRNVLRSNITRTDLGYRYTMPIAADDGNTVASHVVTRVPFGHTGPVTNELTQLLGAELPEGLDEASIKELGGRVAAIAIESFAGDPVTTH